jgi:hypothetical protein
MTIEVGGCRWDERDAEVLEEVVAGELHSKVAGEPGLSTMMVRTPVPAIRSSLFLKPGRSVTSSVPLSAGS